MGCMSSVTTRNQDEEDKCCICLNDLDPVKNPIKVLPCGHRLDQVCFEQYKTRYFLCPLCRKNLYNGFVRLSNDSTTEQIKEAIIDKIIKPDLNTWETEARILLQYRYSPTRGAFRFVVRNGILDLMYELLDQPEGDCNMYLKLNIIVWILRTMSIKDGKKFHTNNPDNYNYANELSTHINNFYSSVSTERLDPQYRQEFEEFFSPRQPGLMVNHFHWISHVWNNNLKDRKVNVLNGAKITLEEIKATLLTVTAYNHFRKIYPYFILWLIANDIDKQIVIS